MCAKWKNNYEPQIIVDDILDARRIDDKGNVRFIIKNRFPDPIPVLFSAVELPEDIPETEKLGIVKRAVSSAAKSTNLNAGALLAEISKEEKKYKELKLHHYVLLSSLSIKHTAKLTPRRIGKAYITFHSHVGKTFDRSPFKNDELFREQEKIENQYASVYVKVKARTPEEAEALGMDSLDLLRGCWNFYFNSKKGFRMSWGPIEPVNELRLGLFHTIHEPNGKCVGKNFWYNPDFTLQRGFGDYNKEWEKVRKTENWIRKNLKDNSDTYRKFLEYSIVRYCRALDEKMLENSFLKLWSLLEHLTGSLKHSYDTTIKRTIFRYRDKQRARQELEHLREHRNRTVHHTQFTQQAENIVFQLKYYVENHLKFLLRWLRIFESFDECWNFLDQTSDLNALRKRIKHAKWALKMFEGK